jgi:hypothetical protein
MLNIVKLRSLEDERFYALLDVVLDIRGEVDFHSQPALIATWRSIVRFGILMPGDGANMRDNYMDLRWKAAKFLEAEGYVREVEYIDQPGTHRWFNKIAVWVDEKEKFYQLVMMLTEEEERRLPGSQAQDLPSAMSRLEQLGDRFHRAALQMRAARAGSSIFEIKTEYDVQTLMHALLETRFDDVRPEEWTGNYAGKSVRTDFLLKPEQVMVETKMIRDGLSDGKVGDELIIDIDRYKKHPDCKALFCFIYDPSLLLKNPTGLERDLSRKTDGLIVRTQVRPKA